MTEQAQQQNDLETPVFNLSLSLDQISFIQGALGKLPTETGAWMVRQLIASQVSPQVEAFQQAQKEEPNDSTETV